MIGDRTLGYIGTVMIPMLLRSGHEVIGLDSDLYERRIFAAGGSIVPVPHLRKDVRDVSRDDLEGLGAIIHLAACPTTLPAICYPR
jgi:nucleoside-diphosphate-sugar epimerase